MEGKERKGEGGNGMMAGKRKLENGEGREACPHPHKILTLRCND